MDSRSGRGKFRSREETRASGIERGQSVRKGGYRQQEERRGEFKPKRPAQGELVRASVPGTGSGAGFRPESTRKKMRWRDMPGGRPDQKGKPKRFGPPMTGDKTEGRPTQISGFRGERSQGQYKGRSARGGDQRYQTHPSRPKTGPADRRSGGASFKDRTSLKPGSERQGLRPTSGSDQRFSARSRDDRAPFRPRRDEGRGSGRSAKGGAPRAEREFRPKSGPKFSQRQGGFSARARNEGPRPFGPATSDASKGRPSSKGPSGAAGKSFAPKKSASYTSKSGSRPGFGQGPRPRPERPHDGSAKPSGRPGAGSAAKFKKRPGPSK
jgi:hypothetical protein